MNIRKLVATVAVAVLTGGGLALASTTAASAHTPEVTATCTSLTVNLTNYEYIPGSPAEFKTVVVTPAIPGIPEVPGVPAIPAVYGPTLFEYAHADNGNGNSDKTRWEIEGWNAGDNGKGWVPTGNTKPGELITAEVPAVPAIPAIPEVSAVTAQVETKPAVAAQDNSVEIIIDGDSLGVARFGHEADYYVPLDGSKGHTYKVIIDAIGTAYDKTITGKTTACPPVTVEVPTLTVTPPTCETDGTLPFLGNPAAQNPNGYEFPGQGFRVYISPAFSGPGTYTATIQKIGAGFDPAFPYGTKVIGQTTQTLVVEGATGFQGDDADASCYVPVPEDETTFGQWTTPVIDCDTEVGAELAISREVTTVTYELDTVTGEVTSTTETNTERDVHVVTQDEVDALDCPVPPVTPEEPTTPSTPEEPLGQGGDDGLNETTVAAESTLAQTGSTLPLAGGALAILAIAAGTGALLLRRKVTAE